MPDSSTLTVRLSNQTKAQLAVLADRTRRTRSVLAAEAIGAYVERELAIVEAIERGRADARAGRVSTHEQMVREAREVVEAARAGR